MIYHIDGKEIPGDYFTKDQKRDDRFVKRAEKAYRAYQKALKKFIDFKKHNILGEFQKRILQRDGSDKQSDGDKGLTIYNISREKRTKIKQPLYIRMNDLARQAKRIIDEKIKVFEENLSEDMADLFALLKGMFSEKTKMCFTPGIAAFLRMQSIKDPDLLKARELLQQSMEVDIGRLSITCEEKQDDGSWGKCEG